MNTSRHLQPSSLRDQALSELRARLISGDLMPGNVYSAAAIASDLGVSSGPVREAMLALVSQGMMEVVRNKGFRVIALTSKDRQNIADLRNLIEIPSMVSLAGSPYVAAAAPKFRAIAESIIESAKREDLIGYLEADRAFHLGLLDLLENERLTEFIGSLRDQTRQFGLHALADQGELVSSAEEHLEILDALIEGDPQKVEAVMRTHLRHLSSGWSAPSLEAKKE